MVQLGSATEGQQVGQLQKEVTEKQRSRKEKTQHYYNYNYNHSRPNNYTRFEPLILCFCYLIKISQFPHPFEVVCLVFYAYATRTAINYGEMDKDFG